MKEEDQRAFKLTEVWLVIVCEKDGENYAIFSSQQKASAWADTKESPCVLSPYIIDEPLYGEARTQ